MDRGRRESGAKNKCQTKRIVFDNFVNATCFGQAEVLQNKTRFAADNPERVR